MLRRSNRNATGCKGRRGINRSAALWPLCRHRHKAHWTGHTSRLDRFKKFETKAGCAFEQLIGEIGSCFIGARIDLEPTTDESAAYIEHWLKALRDDKRWIFKAASAAQKAADYVLECAADHSDVLRRGVA